MTISFRLPDLGEGVHEAEILAIRVVPGQEVREGDIILEIETDKAAVEIPSPATGTVAEILVRPGDRAEVGNVLMTFQTAKGEKPAERPAQPPQEQPQPPPAAGKKSGPVPASPSTRRLARELGVDLQEVTPSGSGGVVTKDDVLAHARTIEKPDTREQKPVSSSASGAGEPEAPGQRQQTDTAADFSPPVAGLPDFARWGPVERLPFRSIRRATASHMATSWSQIPHVWCQDDVDITRLEAFRTRHKDEIAAAGGRLTMTVFAIKAVATALKLYPSFNASLDLAAQEIVLKRYFHIGIAVDSDHGLTVPVIRDVDRKSIKELAIEVEAMVNKVRAGRVSREEMQGGTFTITNAGALGGHHFSAIINHPEVAILGLGQGRMQPAVVTDERGRHEIVPRLIMPVVLCFDHRVVDGADAVRFLKVVIGALQDPDELLITMI